MVEPRFIVSLDNGDVDVEPADAPTTVEGYDIEETAAYSLSGERLNLRLDSGEQSGQSPLSLLAMSRTTNCWRPSSATQTVETFNSRPPATF